MIRSGTTPRLVTIWGSLALAALLLPVSPTWAQKPADDDKQVVVIVIAVKKADIDEGVNADSRTQAARLDQLKTLRQQYTEMLKERRENLRKLAQTVGSDDRQTMAYRQQIAMEHQAHVRRELLDVLVQKRKLQARLTTQRPEERHDQKSAPSVSEAEINEWIDREPSVAKLVATLAQEEKRLNAETAHVRSASGKPSADPVLRRMRQDLAATEKLLKSKREALRPIAIRALQEKGGSDQAKRGGDIAQELAMLDDLEQRLTAELKSIPEGNQALTNNILDLQALQDDVARMQASALKVGAEVDALTLEGLAGGGEPGSKAAVVGTAGAAAFAFKIVSKTADAEKERAVKENQAQVEKAHAEVAKAQAKVNELATELAKKQRELSRARGELSRLKHIETRIVTDPSHTGSGVGAGIASADGFTVVIPKLNDPDSQRSADLEKKLDKLLEEVASLKKSRAK